MGGYLSRVKGDLQIWIDVQNENTTKYRWKIKKNTTKYFYSRNTGEKLKIKKKPVDIDSV